MRRSFTPQVTFTNIMKNSVNKIKKSPARLFLVIVAVIAFVYVVFPGLTRRRTVGEPLPPGYIWELGNRREHVRTTLQYYRTQKQILEQQTTPKIEPHHFSDSRED